MKRIFSAFSVLAMATTFGLAACGGDDDGAPGNGGMAGAPSDNVACVASQDTTCQNATDCKYVVDGSARTAAQKCGKEDCLQSEEENCARDCILSSLDMTSACAACYADFVDCTIANCVAACISDPNSDACHECQVEKGCRPTFDTCSGLPE
jgi:hypothetical protein